MSQSELTKMILTRTSFILSQESSGPHEFQLKQVDRVLARFEPRTDDEEDEEDQRIHLNGEPHMRV